MEFSAEQILQILTFIADQIGSNATLDEARDWAQVEANAQKLKEEAQAELEEEKEDDK